MKLILFMGTVVGLTGCRTERTILAGPTVTGLEAQGQSNAETRFGNQDPSGYQQNSSGGLNAMSEKMFSGKLESQSKKEFATNRNFLTREFGGKKDFSTKSYGGAPKDRRWTDKLFETDERSEGDVLFSEGGREAAVKESLEGTKTVRTRDFSGGERAARTGNYRPAERALEDGRDAPKLTSAKPDRMTSEEKIVRDRIASSEATASEINKFLGKP